MKGENGMAKRPKNAAGYQRRVILGPVPCGRCGVPVEWDGWFWSEWRSRKGKIHRCALPVIPSPVEAMLLRMLMEDLPLLVPHG